jgi:iron complex transport system substrate-binding protein
MSRLSLWCALLLNGLLASATSAEISVIDFSGRQLTLPAPATRIVALAPHSVENLFSAGAGDRLVGVVAASDFPEAARSIPRVGSYNAYSLEAIAASRPDLIVAWGSGNGSRTLAKLESLGVPVYISEPRKLADIPRDIRALGQLAGTEAESEAAAADFERGLQQLALHYGGGQPLPVMYEIWNNPLQTVNGEHLISEVISLCGGRNVFWDAATLAPRVSVESVLARAPRAIVASGTRDSRPEWLDDWRRYPQLPAVRDNGLFFVNPDLLERPTTRILQGARALCRQLQRLRS